MTVRKKIHDLVGISSRHHSQVRIIHHTNIGWERTDWNNTTKKILGATVDQKLNFI